MAEPATTTATGIYCKTCGYDLRASGKAKRCPECGRTFSPDDPKTFRLRPFAAPWKRATIRWAKRAAFLLLVLVVLLGGVWGWCYWGWHEEQAVLAEAGDATVWQPYSGARDRWFYDHPFPGSFAFERASGVILPKTATEANLLPLRKLPGLQRLRVEAPITDAGLAQLRHCPRLWYLQLENPRVTAAGLATLRDLPELETLLLAVNSTVPDAALAGLGTVTQLRVLFLDYTPLTDAGLVHLAPLGKLEFLSIRNTQVTDAGLIQLEKLRSLRYLDLHGTKVTPAGVARFKAARPGCKIYGP